VLRKVLNPLSPVEGMELLIDKLNKTKSNAEFLAAMQKMGQSRASRGPQYAMIRTPTICPSPAEPESATTKCSLHSASVAWAKCIERPTPD
jgi:hypothetical protein